MQCTPMFPTPTSPDLGETLIIRMARPADGPALRRLAELDSAPPPEPGPTLVAEVGGELRVALSLDGGPAIANPFQRTAELAAMLAARVRQLETPATRRWRSIRAANLASALGTSCVRATTEARG
jgi:hypothetical protein